MKHTIWLMMGVIVSAGLIIAFASVHSARRTRSTVSELVERNKSLEKEIAAARQQLAAQAERERNLQAALQEAQTQKTTATSSPQKTTPMRRELADLMETRPALRALFKQSARANLVLSYQPFYAATHLSPEQIDKFEELMSEHEQDSLDLRAAAKSQGLAANDPSLAKIQQQSAEKLRSAQMEILGDAYKELQRYTRQGPLSGFLTSYASSLAYSGIPITASQCQQLLDAFSNASSQFQNGDIAEITTIDTALAMQQAERFFSPAQMATLRTNSNIIELIKLRTQFYQQKNAAAK